MALADLANPSRFLNLANRTIPWLGGADGDRRSPSASIRR